MYKKCKKIEYSAIKRDKMETRIGGLNREGSGRIRKRRKYGVDKLH